MDSNEHPPVPVINVEGEKVALGQKFHDVLIMDCLADEFQSPVLGRLLPKTDG